MSVKITDICIACGACIDECPVEAIVDDDDNPNDDGCYFVHSEKCVECVGHNDEPACASACPTEGCIVWDAIVASHPHRDDIDDDKRSAHTPVVE